MNTLLTLSSPQEWLTDENTARAAEYLLAIAATDSELPLPDLAADALAALNRSSQLTLRYGAARPDTTCQYDGDYNSKTRTIVVTRSSSRARDSFTALHEYGHHLQSHDADWVFEVLTRLGEFERAVLGERVADAFAARVLIPDAMLHDAISGTLTAAGVAALHDRSSASRVAVARRVLDVAGTAPTLVTVTDYFGTVIGGFSNTNDLHRPTTGSSQPDLARLAANVDGPSTVRGHTQTGLLYSTGNARSDLTIELHPDSTGLYFFAVIRPMYRYGSQQWDTERVECVNEACARVFEPTPQNLHYACGTHRCPDCGRCACAFAPVRACPRCGLELSLADIAAGVTEHDVC